MARGKKAPAKGQQQGQQAPPGAYFRIPGVGARPRFVIDTGPCAPGTKKTWSKGNSTPMGFGKFNTLDIDAGLLYEQLISSKFTEHNTTPTIIKPSQLWPANATKLIQVQFESAYSTFRLPGFLAQIMQMYRPMFSNPWRGSSLFQSGANPFPSKALGANWFSSAANEQLATPTLAMNITGTKQTYRMFYEIPVSMYFDLYYELGATGKPLGMPIPRAIVSPQRMAASTRNVIPKVTMAAAILVKNNLTGTASIHSVSDSTSTAATLTVTNTWYRTAWIPTDNMLTEPPGRMWQYTRDFLEFQPAGAKSPAIPLDSDVPGQGQILSLVFATWDPALTTTYGAFAPFTKYTTVQLLLGSKIQLRQTSPGTNQYMWGNTHGCVLPAGFMGWDLGLNKTGKFTNEQAINTLVQNGAQLRINYAQTYTPSAASTVFIGLEVLKKVGS